jgi:[acyl-carrier-protein] S-malonyltransferase
MGGAAVLFPGQGGQQPEMGAPWRDSKGWWVVDRASEVLGEDVSELLLSNNPDRLSRTRDAQVAVMVTSLVAWESAPQAADEEVVAMAGHSLGQITALVAAGGLTLDDGVRLVARRADLTQAAADETPGRMVALLGATPEQASSACAAAGGECWLANDNAPGQIVIAGTPGGIDAAVAAATDLGVKKAMPLKVGGAFHTPLMTTACEPFAAALDDIEFGTGSVVVVGNGDAVAHNDGPAWRSRLVEHLVSPVRWRESQLALASMGAGTFIEVGGPGALVAMAKRTVPEVTCRVVNAPPVGAGTA